MLSDLRGSNALWRVIFIKNTTAINLFCLICYGVAGSSYYSPVELQKSKLLDKLILLADLLKAIAYIAIRNLLYLSSYS